MCAPLGVLFACALAASCSSSSDPLTQLGFSPASIQESASPETENLSLAESPKPETTTAGLESSPDGQGESAVADAQSARANAETDSAPSRTAEADAVSSSEKTDEQPRARSIFANLFSSSGHKADEPDRRPLLTGSTESPAPADQKEAEDKKAGETEAAGQEPDGSAPAKRGSLFAFFAPESGTAKDTIAAKVQEEDADKPEPQVQAVSLASRETEARPTAMWDDPLPGVRDREQLFEITRSSGSDDDGDIDLYEQAGTYQVASAAGLARLAPNGLLKQRQSVDVACLKPQLVHMLKTIERHFGKPVVVTSGYRSPEYNRRVRGAPKSMHMQCAAADIQVAGVGKWELARFSRSLSGRGGVGTYCHTNSVHVDVGPRRDWNWRCR